MHPWLNFILRPVFSLPKPAQVTSVVLFNIGPVTPNRINGLFDSVRKPRCIPTRESFKPSEHPFYDTVCLSPSFSSRFVRRPRWRGRWWRGCGEGHLKMEQGMMAGDDDVRLLDRQEPDRRGYGRGTLPRAAPARKCVSFVLASARASGGIGACTRAADMCDAETQRTGPTAAAGHVLCTGDSAVILGALLLCNGVRKSLHTTFCIFHTTSWSLACHKRCLRTCMCVAPSRNELAQSVLN